MGEPWEDCPHCGGKGWYEVVVTGTAMGPDGPEPVPELAQEQCKCETIPESERRATPTSEVKDAD